MRSSTQNRVARIVPGTPGEVTCANFDDPNRCVIVADVLGDAVVWFALMPRGPRDTVELPPIVDLQDGYAQFVNGWEVLYAPVIERDAETCGDDVVSFSDFLRRFGPGSTTVVDLETRQVTAVICGEEFVEPPTTVVYEGSLDGSIVTPSTEHAARSSIPTSHRPSPDGQSGDGQPGDRRSDASDATTSAGVGVVSRGVRERRRGRSCGPLDLRAGERVARQHDRAARRWSSTGRARSTVAWRVATS